MQMLFELIVRTAMIPFDGCVFQCPVHAFYLAIRPWMLRFCQAVLNAIFMAADVEHMPDVSCRYLHLNPVRARYNRSVSMGGMTDLCLSEDRRVILENSKCQNGV